ncbi:DsrH/TusB family sulfur relay protein [Pasteurellaceae bacterium 22721_9_1]
MLYTFSQANYADAELNRYLQQITANDAVVLWQNAVLLPLKYPQLFQQLTANCYAVEVDLQARNLTMPATIQPISLAELVKLTEQYHPQLAL